MINLRVPFFSLLLSVMLCIAGDQALHAQQSENVPITDQLASEISQLGEVDLFVFADQAAFLSRMDQTLGLENIQSPETTFAKLPRSPFTVTGRQNGAQIPTCQIFVPANITPEQGQEIFAQLMHGWFGQKLRYQSTADLTYRWLIYHEVRHCKTDHYGGDDAQNHRDEIEADLFSFNELATPENKSQLAADIIAFRMITATLFADRSHMTGLSVKYALETPQSRPALSAKQEVAAFLSARQLVTKQAKAIAVGINPTNLELIRAITELREDAENGKLGSNDPLIIEIMMSLDNAVAQFAPKLHGAVATRQAN
ncbi:MAG: hypothetical protein RIG26_01915 [Thalassospira sp.]|uniref:hypothetical protein n=1 Tax=Thalassospira sp. TaxID=1912094 RepID=UPI0032EBB7C5